MAIDNHTSIKGAAVHLFNGGFLLRELAHALTICGEIVPSAGCGGTPKTLWSSSR